jgi:hypothetical protein
MAAVSAVSDGFSVDLRSEEQDKNRLEELCEKLFAVHATKKLPVEGIVYAGFGERFTHEVGKELYLDVRWTVHFALGELVRPVGDNWMNWENSPYTVVAPLKSLMPQLININCYDTFVLGNFKMDPKTTLVLPQDEACNLPQNRDYAIWTYDPKTTKIRDAIDALIRSKKGWAVTMSSEDIEDKLGEAHLGGVNINTPEFFDVVKKFYPHVGIGLRFDKLDGKGYLFSSLEMSVMASAELMLLATFAEKKNSEGSTEQMEQLKTEIQKNLGKIDAFAQTLPFSADLKKEYEARRIEVLNWLNILGLEIQLNASSKSLKGASVDIWRQVYLKRNNSTDLENLAKLIMDELPSYERPQSVLTT